MKQKPNSYIAITRQWKEGDWIMATYPMEMRIEKTPDNPQKGDLLYGFIVLAGKLGAQVPALFSGSKLYNDYYTYDYHVPTGLKTTLNVDEKYREKALKRVSNGLVLEIEDGMIVNPLYDVHQQCYVVYWN